MDTSLMGWEVDWIVSSVCAGLGKMVIAFADSLMSVTAVGGITIVPHDEPLL